MAGAPYIDLPSGVDVINPFDNPTAYDKITLAGVDSPGIARIGDVKRNWEWDVKAGRGASGGVTTFVGRKPAQFSVRFEAWLREHFIAWKTFIQLFKYDAKLIRVNLDTGGVSGIKAVNIYHPALSDLDITACTTESIGGWVHEGKGLWVRNVEFLEYLPPPPLPAISTPAGATDVDPAFPVDPKIAELSNQLAKQDAQIAANGNPFQ